MCLSQLCGEFHTDTTHEQVYRTTHYTHKQLTQTSKTEYLRERQQQQQSVAIDITATAGMLSAMDRMS